MAQHYFGHTLDDEQRRRIANMMPAHAGDERGLQLTPAMMEQLCAEHDSVDSMLDVLAMRMSGPMLVPGR